MATVRNAPVAFRFTPEVKRKPEHWAQSTHASPVLMAITAQQQLIGAQRTMLGR
jgi:hypothetical protein